MPVFTGAISVLVRSYVTRERSSLLVVSGAGSTVTPLYRDQTHREYSTPYYDDPPETQVASTPVGFLFQGYENSLRSAIPAKGDHIDRFATTPGDWKYGDGTTYTPPA